jgi:two-component system NtrC family sensor kinase
MRRRSRAGGKSPNAQAPKAVARKSRIARKAVRRRSFAGTHETELARVIRERDEAREQQTATADVLKIISRSTFDLKEVLNTLTESAARLCAGDKGIIFQLDGDVLRLIANLGHSREAERYWLEHPMPIDGGSATGRAVLEGRAIHIPDVLADPKYRATRYQELSGYRSVLCVPLLRDGTTIGTFSLSRDAVTPFTDRQIKLVETFADQAVIAIENTRLFEAEQQRTRELTESLEQQTATSQVLQVISSSPGELQPVFASMLENAVRICDAAFGNIYRWDGSAMRLVAAHNTPPAFAEARRRSALLSGPKTAMGRMVATNAVAHVIDATADEAYFERDASYVEAVELGGVRTLLVVPLLKDNALMGAFTVYRQEVRPFAAKQIELVQNFAAQAVIAIENARLLSELRQRTTDLTEALEQQIATSDVLQVISSSTGDLERVFGTVLEKAVRYCDAEFGTLFLQEDNRLSLVAAHNMPAAFSEAHRRSPGIVPGGPGETAMRTRRTVHIPDLAATPSYLERHRRAVEAVELGGVRAVVVVPMLKDDEPIGFITINRPEVRPFTDKQIDLLKNFAAQAVIAIENARLLGELRQRTDELGQSVGELRALGEVSQAVNSTLELETVLSTIVANAVQLSGTEAGAIYVFDELQRALRLRATHGMDQELIDALSQHTIGMNEPYVAAVFAKREPLQVSDLRAGAPSPVNEVILRAGFRAVLVAPLIRGDEVVGLLVVRRRSPGGFAQNIVDLIKTFGAQSAVAIENARLFKNVETSLEDLRTTQDRLVQTQKLASLGQLTAGIAHEIKNPLNFVNNFSGVSTELIDELREALDRMTGDDKTRAEITELSNTLRDNLNKIAQHGKRADSIVKNMLLHSREGSGEHRLVDANALVEESLNLAYHGARAENQGFKVNIERSFDPAAGQVDAFPQEITRAVLNLISNGFYAATKRKELGNGDGYEPTLTASTKNLGDRVEITIRDNGTGIPREVKEKMFNPFFTTKPAGEGTGLGLSITHDIIVKQHSGSIEVDSQPGEFTEVRIILPRTAALITDTQGRA